MAKKRKGQRQLDMAVAAIHQRYGAYSLFKGRPPAASVGVPHLSTGFPALDRALGMGGLPKGSLCELVGPTTSGKTTLALKFLVQAQGGGGQVAYLDQATCFDPDYAHRCGVDLSRLLVGAPADGREALAMAEALVRSGSLAALVFDALDVLWTEPGAEYALTSFLNRLSAPLTRSGTILLVLHESPTGVFSPLSALASTAAVRLQLVRERWLRRHGDVRGYEVRVEVLKNRLGPEGRAVTLSLEFNGTVRGDGL